MNSNEQNLSIERLKEALSYDPDTGKFTWLIPGAAKGGAGRVWVGKEAGAKKPSGYICINLDGVRYRAHRLAWMIMTGGSADLQVDHRNGIRDDNRWSNLRLATQTQNSANMMRRNNRLGAKGVVAYNGKSGVKYRAHVYVAGRTVYLGSFATLSEAKGAYLAAATKHFGEFARAS